MNILTQIKQTITESANNCLNKNYIKPENIIYPPNNNLGDLSLPCFELAKNLHITPHDAAISLKNLLSDNKNEHISSMQVAGPYLNFKINKETFTNQLLKQINKEKDKYGIIINNKKERIMVEYSNANTHKEYHIGHLRNISFGDSINKLLAANGQTSIPVSYINDFGIHVAKTLWCLKEHHSKQIPPTNKGEFLGKVYSDSTSKINENPVAKDLVSFMMKKIESRNGEEFKLWQKTRKWSIKQFDEIYKELNINFKETFYESDFIEKGIKQIKELKDKKILIESENAIIADLNEYNLGVLVIMRSDGTALYPTADIPLAIYKLTKFKLDKSIIVVDVRQSLYFKQLFKLLELLGYKQEMIHLSYEFVKLPSGMMSSRTGNIITYTELKEKLINKAKNEIIKRHEKWSTRKINETANTLATAIMKFEMLKVDANQIINFDIEKSLKFEGYTAGYIEYTYARISSILKTFDKENIKLKLDSKTTNTLEDAKERDIILKIAKYPETIEKAAKTYNPSMLAKYLFELAQLINDYYHAIPILKANKERKNAKILLVKSSNQIIKNGLNLLGIEVLEEM